MSSQISAKALGKIFRYLIDGGSLNGEIERLPEPYYSIAEQVQAEPPTSKARATIFANKVTDPEVLKEVSASGPITDLENAFDNEPIDISKLPFSDAGNSEVLNALYGQNVRYDHLKKIWLLFSGYWKPDSDGEIERLALQAARERMKIAIDISNNDKRKKAVRWSLVSENRGRLRSCIDIARILPPIADSGENWDPYPLLLGCKNGVFDLESGVFRQGRRSDRITKVTGCDYIPGAKADRWNRFLLEIFDGNQELIKFNQRAAGYSATGLTTEQAIFILWGKGANGKSIYENALGKVFGDYSASTPFSTLELSNNAQTNDIAALRGKRFVTVSEVNEARRLNEARVKNMASSDPVTARFLFGEYFTYTPTYKVWMATNHKPIITGNDEGIWRRIRLIPFTVSFRGREDRNLADDLDKELPGILNWIIEGAKEWLRHGLGMPEMVKNATESYRAESDILSQFLEQCTIYRDGARTKAGELYAEYERWCDENGEKALSGTAFGRKLKEREDITWSRISGFVYYLNLGILQR